MITIGVLTAKFVTENELREFTLEVGGEWRNVFGFNEGVIDRDGATVLIYLDPDSLLNGDDEERADHRARLGTDPKSIVVVGAMRVPGSNELSELSRSVLNQIADRWSGVIIW